MQLPFSKYHGAGNDFVIIDNRSGNMQLTTSQIAWLCNRRFGIGSDGLILLNPSHNADFAMQYFNSDGNESTMCGNGGRCIAAFAAKQNIITNKTEFEAIDGIHQADILSSTENEWMIRLRMGNVKLPETQPFLSINTGSPHAVIFADNVETMQVVEEGKKVRNHEYFERIGGTNVNFVQKKESGFYVRTYERGVEDETLSCGTGVTAVALVSAFLNNQDKGEIPIITRGGILSVSFIRTSTGFSDIWLTGPASFVFEGKVNIPEL